MRRGSSGSSVAKAYNYIATDALLEAMIGADPRTSSVALKALGMVVGG